MARETAHGNPTQERCNIPQYRGGKSGSLNWTRTSDPLINSQLLYQLSYQGTEIGCVSIASEKAKNEFCKTAFD